jgi:hypothetical protein
MSKPSGSLLSPLLHFLRQGLRGRFGQVFFKSGLMLHQQREACKRQASVEIMPSIFF